MNDKKFDFFQDHSRSFLEMALKVDRQVSMGNPDGYGTRTGECGDTVEMFLKVRQKKVQAISYHVDKCFNTNTCCNVVAPMAAWDITPEMVMDYL